MSGRLSGNHHQAAVPTGRMLGDTDKAEGKGFLGGNAEWYQGRHGLGKITPSEVSCCVSMVGG